MTEEILTEEKKPKQKPKEKKIPPGFMKLFDWKDRDDLFSDKMTDLRAAIRHIKFQHPRKYQINYARWMCFLESLYGIKAIVPEEIEPSFLEYVTWLDDFPGWTFCPLNPSHRAWQDEYAEMKLPMNEYYDRHGLYRPELIESSIWN